MKYRCLDCGNAETVTWGPYRVFNYPCKTCGSKNIGTQEEKEGEGIG